MKVLGITPEVWQIVWFTTWVSALSVALTLPLAIGTGWWLSRYRGHGRAILETLIALPLVMPPVATGLILLLLFGRRGWIGGMLHDQFGIDLVFTWKAVVIALSVMCYPLIVRSARAAFESVNPRLEQIARTLGAGPRRVFWEVSLPLARRGILSGTVLAFSRALGEFGATVMIAGNIPGRTSTLSLAIFQSVQLGEDRDAYRLLIIAVILAFGGVWLSERLLERKDVG